MEITHFVGVTKKYFVSFSLKKVTKKVQNKIKKSSNLDRVRQLQHSEKKHHLRVNFQSAPTAYINSGLPHHGAQCPAAHYHTVHQGPTNRRPKKSTNYLKIKAGWQKHTKLTNMIE